MNRAWALLALYILLDHHSAAAADPVQNAGARRSLSFDFGDEGSVVSVGKEDPSVVGRPDGNCLGCASGPGPVGMETSPSQSIEQFPYESLRGILQGGGTLSERWGNLDGRGNFSGSLGDSLVQYDNFLKRLYSKQTFLPLQQSSAAENRALETLTAVHAGTYLKNWQAISFPALPSRQQIYTDASAQFDVAMPQRNLSGREGHHLSYSQRAEGYLMESYGPAFDEIERSITFTIGKTAQAVGTKSELVQDDNEANDATLTANVEELIETLNPNNKPGNKIPLNYDELLYKQLPQSAKLWSDPKYLESAIPGKSVSIVRTSPLDLGSEWRTRYNYASTSAYRGIVAKKLDAFLYQYSDRLARSANADERALARKAHEDALAFLDIISGLAPITSDLRDLYEAYSGEDVMTGEILSDHDRTLRILSVGLSWYSILNERSLSYVKASIDEYGAHSPQGATAAASKIISDSKSKGLDWREVTKKLQHASKQVWNYRVDMPTGFNFNMGTGSRKEADLLGQAWVGEKATRYTTRAGDTVFVSVDGLTQYRPPTWKTVENKWQANFQRRVVNKGKWLSNGHLDIIE
ncbi:pre-toxin TG domain-containing protein [Rhizobium johnstonii]|uniref:pre-toxin TG domain-containing protein n=1 Tax=Rhizobium johnstonii TaxID=3019933 RepID=UPI003F974BE9